MPRRTLKRMISISASQNGGKPMPNVETMRTAWSGARPWLRAAMVAIGTAMRMERTTLASTRARVGSMRVAISLQHVDLVEDRAAHLALEEVADEIEVLRPHRLIEAVLGADVGDGGGGGAGAEKDAGGIARDQPDENEGDDADAEQNRQELQRAEEDKSIAVHGDPVRRRRPVRPGSRRNSRRRGCGRQTKREGR